MGEHGHIPLYFGVGFQPMRNAIIRTLFERTYYGHFGACVHVGVPSGMPVFLERCRYSITNVWPLFEYGACALATNMLRSGTVVSHLSAIKGLHRFSRGFELDPTDSGLETNVKVGGRALSDAGTEQPCVGLFGGK